ncbi:T9SS type A sorting domain-containing protein [candidate division KSB1 bacterium]|nr:T9SS type A sorting domain-containing protein [candidate division KSB1 bacterium]
MKLQAGSFIQKFASRFRHQRIALKSIQLIGAFVLMWDPVPNADLMGYKIYYGIASRNYTHKIDVGKVTKYEFKTLPLDTTLYFAVTAYDSAGNESPYSAEITIEWVPPESPVPESAPGESSLEIIYNFPNPFYVGAENTHIRYFLTEASPVSIRIYDINHKLVKIIIDGAFRAPGEHVNDTWDGKNAADETVGNGVYICQVMAKEKTQHFKIAALR